MNNIEWLLAGDPVIKRLTQKYLLDEKVAYIKDGYIKKYLELYNHDEHRWGHGFYGPKWIGSHYTLMELMTMEIDPNHPIFQDALMYLFYAMWSKYHHEPKNYLDMCIAGMLLNLLSYGNIFNQDVYDMIDYILDHKMVDGGWNCRWHKKPKTYMSSVHTTLSVLEGLSRYKKSNHHYRIDEIDAAIKSGIDCLMARYLVYVKGTTKPIHPEMMNHHYPPRWKYDYLKVLEFLADIKYPMQDEMIPVIEHLKSRLKKGKLSRGSQISGLLHFQLEDGKYGRFNTLRAYKVLKFYQPDEYIKFKKMIIE